MKSSRVIVPWPTGLNLLAATRVVRLAQNFPCRILIKCGGKLADARSILSILLLTATMGAALDVEASGEDEANAASAIAQIFSESEDSTVSEPVEPR
jgi:phosphotransferase system HPr (HPr) family protein